MGDGLPHPLVHSSNLDLEISDSDVSRTAKEQQGGDRRHSNWAIGKQRRQRGLRLRRIVHEKKLWESGQM